MNKILIYVVLAVLVCVTPGLARTPLVGDRVFTHTVDGWWNGTVVEGSDTMLCLKDVIKSSEKGEWKQCYTTLEPEFYDEEIGISGNITMRTECAYLEVISNVSIGRGSILELSWG